MTKETISGQVENDVESLAGGVELAEWDRRELCVTVCVNWIMHVGEERVRTHWTVWQCLHEWSGHMAHLEVCLCRQKENVESCIQERVAADDSR